MLNILCLQYLSFGIIFLSQFVYIIKQVIPETVSFNKKKKNKVLICVVNELSKLSICTNIQESGEER